MRKILLFLILFPAYSFSQNLLANGSFEEENSCIEYKVNCAPEGWIYNVPSFIYYFKDPNYAHTGVRFIALIAGHAKKTYFRTFVRSKLVCGLRKGNAYRLEFYIKSEFPVTDSIGVYFTSYDFLFEKQVYRKIQPSIFLTDAVMKPDKKDTNWQRVVIDYTARGDEAFITLGNFRKGDITGPTGRTREDNYFVLFDDISMVPLDPNERLCSDWKQSIEDIYAQDERHEYLDRLIRYKRNQPPEKITPTVTIQQKIDTVVLPDILFQTGSASLSNASYQVLDSINNFLSARTVDSVVVEGHTDSIGTFEKNRQLSLNRSNSVIQYFGSKMPNATYITRGWASDKPVADNRTATGRQKNRRVEIYLYVRE